MKAGDLVKVKFAQDKENGMIIEKRGENYFDVLINGDIHRATLSMMEKITTEPLQDEAQ
jgi:hypothetical protein